MEAVKGKGAVVCEMQKCQGRENQFVSLLHNSFLKIKHVFIKQFFVVSKAKSCGHFFPFIGTYQNNIGHCGQKMFLTKQSKNHALHIICGEGIGLFQKPLFLSLLSLALFMYCSCIFAAVSEITPTDVTTRALSVVWVSDEPVTSATIRVYSDIDGVNDLTPTLTITVDSAQVPNAHVQGIVKVTATGLSPDTDYFVQTETVGLSSVETVPAFSSLLLVHTAKETVKINGSNLPIINDVLLHDVYYPDGVTPAPGTLVIASVKGLSAYPLTAFTGENGLAPQTAAIDTNNFFGIDGSSLELIPDNALKIAVFRGLLCSSDFAHQKLLEYRRVPSQEATTPISSAEFAPKCYLSDPICDGKVNVLDMQFVMNSFGNDTGSCAYNPTVDIVSDGQINDLDVQRVLSDFGTAVPTQN